MKKISAIVLAMLLTVALFATLSAGAAGEKVTVEAKTVVNAAGNLEVTYYVTFADGTYVWNGGFDVGYDTATLELVSEPKAVTARNDGLGGQVGKDMVAKTGSFRFAFAGSEAFETGFEFAAFTAEFKLVGDATEGTTWAVLDDSAKFEDVGESGTETSKDYAKTGESNGPTENEPAIVAPAAETTTTAQTTTVQTTTIAPVDTTTGAGGTTTVAVGATTTTKAATTTKASPNTGATAPIALISLVALAGAGIAVVSLKKRK